MSFSSKLKVDSIEYNVMIADYEITQPDDGTGLPNSRTVGGKIELRIETQKGTELFDWASSNNQLRDGELIFYNRDNVSTFKRIDFKDAYCIKYKEHFDYNNNDPIFTDLIIAARELNLRGSKFTNDWDINS